MFIHLYSKSNLSDNCRKKKKKKKERERKLLVRFFNINMKSFPNSNSVFWAESAEFAMKTLSSFKVTHAFKL